MHYTAAKDPGTGRGSGYNTSSLFAVMLPVVALQNKLNSSNNSSFLKEKVRLHLVFCTISFQLATAEIEELGGKKKKCNWEKNTSCQTFRELVNNPPRLERLNYQGKGSQLVNYSQFTDRLIWVTFTQD